VGGKDFEAQHANTNSAFRGKGLSPGIQLLCGVAASKLSLHKNNPIDREAYCHEAGVDFPCPSASSHDRDH